MARRKYEACLSKYPVWAERFAQGTESILLVGKVTRKIE